MGRGIALEKTQRGFYRDERECWRAPLRSRVPGRLATAGKPARVPDCFIMEWLAITLAANVICQLGKQAPLPAQPAVSGLGPLQQGSAGIVVLPLPSALLLKLHLESGDAFSQAIMDAMTLLRAAALRCPLQKGSGSSSWQTPESIPSVP